MTSAKRANSPLPTTTSHVRSHSDHVVIRTPANDDASSSSLSHEQPAPFGSTIDRRFLSPSPAHHSLQQSPIASSPAASRHASESASYLTRPLPNQSIKSYLQTQDSGSSTDVDRENAHFFISEALISAMEQMKCCGQMSRFESLPRKAGDESDSESAPSTLSDHPTSATAFVDSSPIAIGSPSIDISSSWSPRNGSQSPPQPPPPDNSAEAVAVRLLNKFDDHTLPSAIELDWLVRFEETGRLDSLAMPSGSVIASPMRPRLRGNFDWAPPRPQVIYHVQTKPASRKIAIARQNGRCPGCGTRVDAASEKRMSYCEYLGKYFCRFCHENKITIIPGRILHKWDFHGYRVCNLAFGFIQQLFDEPLFDVQAVNPRLYARSGSLDECRRMRVELAKVAPYIRSCAIHRADLSATSKRVSGAVECVHALDALPPVLTDDVHVYSLALLREVKDGTLRMRLEPVLAIALDHISGCELCLAKGFVCELCRAEAPIFPFQLNSVHECDDCHACYHSKCYLAHDNRLRKRLTPGATLPIICPKCERIDARKRFGAAEQA